MASKTTEMERQAFEASIRGADKVEIKITVPDEEEAHAIATLEVERRDATRRMIYFFDTPKLLLYEAGVVLRARKIEDDTDDSTVKKRPVDPDAVAKKWFDVDGFKLEADAVGDKVVMSASLKAEQRSGEIDEVAEGKRAISKLFSTEQEEFLAAIYGQAVDLGGLAVLGPVPTLRADIDRPGMAYELTTELWKLPDGTDLLELSIKCPPEEAAVARKVFEGFLVGHGLNPHGAQATKTRRALECFAARL